MRNGVADCRNGRAAACLADPERRPVSRSVDQLDGDLRHLAETQNRITLPVARADAVLVETDTLFDGPADALHDTAFELVDRAIGVDDEPSIGRTPNPGHAHDLVDFDLSDYSGIGGHILVLREADSASLAGPGGETRPPAGHPGDMLDDFAGARVRQHREAVGDR